VLEIAELWPSAVGADVVGVVWVADQADNGLAASAETPCQPQRDLSVSSGNRDYRVSLGAVQQPTASAWSSSAGSG
jgi:hypothetical protein